MSTSEKNFRNISVIVALHSLLFFLGISLWNYNFGLHEFFFDPEYEAALIIIAVVATVGLSYLSRSLFSGLFIGVSVSTAFMLGFLVGGLIILPHEFAYDSWYKPQDPTWTLYTSILYLLQNFFFLMGGFRILRVIFAYSSLGMFFGLFGYISQRLFMEEPVTKVYAFRDYWSSVFRLGRNIRREDRTLDQRLSKIRVPSNIRIREWWKRVTQRLQEPEPELIFVSEEEHGNVYDLSTGRRIVSDVLNPVNLTARYKPSIMNAPALTHTFGGVRKLAFEEIISRFLGWFMNSKLLWVVYIALSVLFSIGIIRSSGVPLLEPLEIIKSFFEPRPTDLNLMDLLLASKLVYAICIVIPGIMLFIVWFWRRFSMKFFIQRPDERMLIFAVYIILALFFGMFHRFFSHWSYNISFFSSEDWIVWDIWTRWLGTLTLLLGLAYIFVHRESEVSNVYLYHDASSGDESSSFFPYKDSMDNPFWLKEEGETRTYWVLRFMYFWRYELTTIPHSDWERIEVWVDARTGEAKWIVSDYHYRELWYKVEGDLADRLTAAFLMNFHTPIPFVKKDEINTISKVFQNKNKEILRLLVNGKTELGETSISGDENPWMNLHSADWIKEYGLTGVAASFCSRLSWSYWRYPWGIDNREKYGDHPAAKPEEQPKY
jgi:hypothetical protein